MMIPSDPLFLLGIFLVHKPPNYKGGHTCSDSIGDVAYTDNDIVQAIIILKQGGEHRSEGQVKSSNGG